MAKKCKIKKHITQEELPDFLRKIADALENGAPESDAYLVVIEGFKKLKINIRNDFGHTAVKVTAQPMPETESAQSDESQTQSVEIGIENDTEKPKYKALKKRMKSSFKSIFKAIHTGNLPSQEVTEEFIADSHLMVDYEGYGDEYYAEYIAACDDFQKAVKKEDIEAAHKACDELNSIKAHCHAQHK